MICTAIIFTDFRGNGVYGIHQMMKYIQFNNSCSSNHHGQRCKPRICADVLRHAVYGKWSFRIGLTPEEIRQRRKMDENIRVKNGWPANLSRGDLRCGSKFDLPSHPLLQAQCDPESKFPCCNQETGWCGSTIMHCSCPICTDLRLTIPAEIGTWIPSEKNCRIKYFSQSEACDLLNNHVSHLVFLGDSLIRQLSSTLYLILSNNFESGALPQSISHEDYEDCRGEYQLTHKRCSMDIAATSTDQVTPSSLCGGNLKFKLDLVGDYIPAMSDYVIKKVKELLNKTDSYILVGVGLHYQLDHARVITVYIKPILDLIQSGNGWPRLIWMGLHSENGYVRTDRKTHNSDIKHYNNIIHDFLIKRGIPVIDNFDLAEGVKSYDGRHYGVGFNTLKMQIFLNFLEESFERCTNS